jgi:hypothetical protein
MAILVLVGMLLTGHVRFAWRARRNRGNGSLSRCQMIAFSYVTTAFFERFTCFFGHFSDSKRALKHENHEKSPIPD